MGLRVHIAIKLSFRFVNITIAVYGAVSEIFDHGFGFSFKEMGLLVDALYCSILLFVFCDCSHKSTLTVNNTQYTVHRGTKPDPHQTEPLEKCTHTFAPMGTALHPFFSQWLDGWLV